MTTIEGLECRQLLAATPLVRVKSIEADNRGEVTVQLSERAVGVRGSAAQLYTAGADGKLFTSDDRRESVRFTYSENKKQIKLKANLPKDTPYRIKLDGKTRIKSEANGALLDGDFQSNGSSGDGRAGGNYEAQFSRDKSSTPTAVMRTSQGDVYLRMRGDIAPLSVSNFLSYANTGRYDKTFVARNDANFVIQGGSLQITGDGQDASDIVKTTKDANLVDEAPGAISNTRGTMAFARGAGNDATNEWFINLGANGFLDSDGNGGGFTVFAQIINNSMSTVDTISAKPIAALHRGTAGSPTGVLESTTGVFLAHTPVTSLSDVTGSVQPVSGLSGTESQFLVTGGFQPTQDLMVIYRVAPFMSVSSK